MIGDGSGGDGWEPFESEWLYLQEYEPPPRPWWQQRDNVIAGSAGVALVVLCLIGFMAFTAGAGERSTHDRLPVVIGGNTTSTLPSVTTQSTSTTTVPPLPADNITFLTRDPPA